MGDSNTFSIYRDDNGILNVLDIILAIGMKVKSDGAVRFRQWANRHLYEFAVKGFTLDDGRLVSRILPLRNDIIRKRLRPRRPRADGYVARFSLLAETGIWERGKNSHF